MASHTRERMSVQSAQMLLEQAQWCLDILKKIGTVLQFGGDITLCRERDKTAVLFIKPDFCRQLTISSTDPLKHDLYACVLVRVQEAGGLQNLPQCNRTATNVDGKTMNDSN